MSRAAQGAESPDAGRRCSKCGLVARPGETRCDFCRSKLPPEGPAEAARPTAVRRPVPAWLRTAWAVLAPLCVVGATVALLFHFGKGFGGPDASSSGPLRGDPGRSQTFAACERFIRGQVAPPSTLKSFSSGLVADEGERYLVTGTADVVDGTGFILRKRYSCKVRVAAGTGPVVEEGHLF